MGDIAYKLFADDELLVDKKTIKLFQEYNIPGWIIPTSGFSSVKLYKAEKGKEFELIYTDNLSIQDFIKSNFQPYSNSSSS